MSGDHFKSHTFDITFPAEHGADGMGWALDASVRARRGRGARRQQYPDPVGSHHEPGETASPFRRCSPASAVHHHLIRQGLRTEVGLVIETGEAREVHHFALLAGYGAEAINPYLAFETLVRMRNLDRCRSRCRRRRRSSGSLHQGDQQGPAQGDVQDGHLHLPILLRGADSRRGRPVVELRRPLFHRDGDHHRRCRLVEIARETVGRHRVAYSDAPIYRTCSTRRRICLPPARRGPCLDPRERWPSCSTRCAAIRGERYKAFARPSTSRTSGC